MFESGLVRIVHLKKKKKNPGLNLHFAITDFVLTQSSSAARLDGSFAGLPNLQKNPCSEIFFGSAAGVADGNKILLDTQPVAYYRPVLQIFFLLLL